MRVYSWLNLSSIRGQGERKHDQLDGSGDRLDRKEDERSCRYLHEVSCMAESDFNFDDEGRYYTDLAAAFVRGKIGGAGDLPSEELIRLGRDRGLRLHKFKRQAELP